MSGKNIERRDVQMMMTESKNILSRFLLSDFQEMRFVQDMMIDEEDTRITRKKKSMSVQ